MEHKRSRGTVNGTNVPQSHSQTINRIVNKITPVDPSFLLLFDYAHSNPVFLKRPLDEFRSSQTPAGGHLLDPCPDSNVISI